MNRDDAQAWDSALRAWQRPYQEEAYAQLDSLHWWIRQRYNLLPTDPRYLDLTEGDIRTEFWLHVLEQRRATAKKEGVDVASLDDLLMAATVDEKMALIDKELEEKAKLTVMQGERETVSHWKAEEHGGSND